MTFRGLEQGQTQAQTATVSGTSQTIAAPAIPPKQPESSALIGVIVIIAAVGILVVGGFLVRLWWK
jgi:hypothetical protein